MSISIDRTQPTDTESEKKNREGIWLGKVFPYRRRQDLLGGNGVLEKAR
jgi:hypothetical protein